MAEKADQQKVHIERAIVRARDGVGERIDELDRKLRNTLDIEALASEHAPQLVVTGAVAGFLIAFGFPKAIKRVVQVGVPIAVFWKLKQVWEQTESDHRDSETL